jgi:hypothetical protein
MDFQEENVYQLVWLTVGIICSRVHIREDSPCGTTVLKIATSESGMEENRNLIFSIYDGNVGGVFQVMR